MMAITSLGPLSLQPHGILLRGALQGLRHSVQQSTTQFVPDHVLINKHLLTFLQLKITHKMIYIYVHKTSGTHWDNTLGANIVGNAANHTWESHLTMKVCTVSR